MPPEASLHIGDSLRFDVGGASRAGMRTAWYRRPGAREQPSPELMPDLIVPSMAGIASELTARPASTLMLRFSIFTLFPQMFTGPFGESIIRRAIDDGKVQIDVYDLRTWTHDRHRTADDRPYGGGAGMVLMAATHRRRRRIDPRGPVRAHPHHECRRPNLRPGICQ